MANPFASIWEEDGVAAVVKPKPKVVPKVVVKPVVDHTEAKAIYEVYKTKAAILEERAVYAKYVLASTGENNHGMTPVRPLATCGPGGGPLLCDYCGKPMVLEGGKHNGKYADEAWAKETDSVKDGVTEWKSYISGGMVIHIVENGTLRIYHGYGREGNCDTLGRAKQEAEEKFFVKDLSKCGIVWRFLEEEIPDKVERQRIFSDLVNVVYGFDPGLGTNKENENADHSQAIRSVGRWSALLDG